MFERFDSAPLSIDGAPLSITTLSGNREQRLDESKNPGLGSAPGSERVRWAPFFTSVLLFVGAVSVYDGYLVVRTGDMIEEFEKNPVGLYLIKIDNGSPSVFLRVKAAGTILALAALSFLHRRSRRLASPIAFALVAFQTGLLIFLEGPFS
jgi:hypothetical protein